MITLSPLDYRNFAKDPKGFARALGRQFRETGFGVISHHGLSPEGIDATLSAAKAVFALPDTVKHRYFDPEGGGARGYTPFGTENAKGETAFDQKEFWHHGRPLPAGHRLESVMPPNVEVTEIPGWTATLDRMFHAFDALGRDLARAVAIDLGLDPTYFDSPLADGNSVMRLLHYPPQTTAPPPGSVRAAAHGDINVLTLLLGAEEAGLQILGADGDWHDITPPDGCLVINVGDMLSRLTNGVLPSTVHRVLNPAPERARFPRYSMPFFLHFRPDFLIETLPQCISEQRPNAYPEPLLTHDFLIQRLQEIGLIRG